MTEDEFKKRLAEDWHSKKANLGEARPQPRLIGNLTSVTVMPELYESYGYLQGMLTVIGLAIQDQESFVIQPSFGTNILAEVEKQRKKFAPIYSSTFERVCGESI